MPHDAAVAEAERATLGAVLLAPDPAAALVDVRAVVAPEHMPGDRTRRVYSAMLALAERGDVLDPVTVAAEAGDPITAADVSELIDGLPRAAHAPTYAALVRKHADRRRLARLGQRLAVAALDGGDTAEMVDAIAAAGKGAGSPDANVAKEIARLRARREAQRLLEREERGDPKMPTLATLREHLAAPRAETRWTVPRWQPTGSRVVLAAQFKAGKTTTVGNLIRSLVDGDDWLGVATVTPIEGNIALIDTEMSETMLLDWLADQSVGADDRVLPVALRGRVGALDLLDAGRRAEWATLLREAGVQYLVLDCLRPVLDALGLDEHTEVGRFLVALDALLAEAGISDCLTVHHMGHAGERSRGDSRLRDWPDVEWRLLRQGDDDDPAAPRYITAYGRDVDIPETQLRHDPTTRRLTAVGGTRREVAEREALEAIVAAVEEAGELSVRGAQDAIEDVPRDVVRASLSRAVRDGILIVEEGKRGAKLHRLADDRAGVCGSVREPLRTVVREQCAAPKGSRTHSLTPADRAEPCGGGDRTVGESPRGSDSNPWSDA